MKSKTIEAVIFDLDGTLVTTNSGYRKKLIKEVLEIYGKNASIESMDKFWFGMDRNGTISDEFGLEPDLFWKTFNYS